MSIDHQWLRDKIRDILAVTSRGHSRERFLEVETLVSQMRDHLDHAAPHAPAPDAAVEANRLLDHAHAIIRNYAGNNPEWQDIGGRTQDPLGAHRWLKDYTAIRARSAALPKGDGA